MKKLLCILMSALVLVSAIGYAEALLASQSPAGAETREEALERMIPVLDSLARGLGVEGEIPYSASSPEFVWTQLYLMGVNWSAENDLVSQGEEQITVPSAVMLEFAQASFQGLAELPEIPETLSASIRYDETAAAYLLSLSDAGDTYIVIERYATNAAGDLIVGFGLYSQEDRLRLGGFTATMSENVGLDFFEEPEFPFSVKDAHMETAEDFNGLAVTGCNILYLAEESPAPTVAPIATPTPTSAVPQYPELSKGSRGEAVRSLQKRLNDLGYDAGSADGIFGSQTKLAVRYFQDALGVNQNGVATNSLQQRLYSSNAPKYAAYVQLKKGSTGVRVEKLQNALRKLGYLAEPVDGDFGDTTQSAVKLFQREAGLKVDGIAGVNTLKALYKSNAPECDAFISLKKGDTGIRVTEMQKRLIKLGFLSGKASGAYDNKTVAAVADFLKAIGETGNGKKADAKIIEKMFDYVAPTPTPTADPTATPTADPTTDPTATPTADPTTDPTATPTADPTTDPTATPTADPTATPTAVPTPTPTAVPTATPTAVPTPTPTAVPTATPTSKPQPEQAITNEELNAFVQLLNNALSTTKSSTEAVTWLQTKLNTPVNGVYDAATKAAVAAYQTSNGLTSTGLADESTVAKLTEA